MAKKHSKREPKREPPKGKHKPKGKRVAPSPPEKKKSGQLEFGPPPRKGRFSKLSRIPRKTYEEMLGMIRNGVTAAVAAGALGIHPQTFDRWMTYGREKGGLYRRFYEDVLKAGCNARSGMEEIVALKSPDTWLKASPAAKLTPDMPQWGEKQVMQIEGGENPIQIATQQILRVEQKDFAQALKIMQECGYISITEEGKQALLSMDSEEVTEEDVDGDYEGEEVSNTIDEKPNGKPHTNGKKG